MTNERMYVLNGSIPVQEMRKLDELPPNGDVGYEDIQSLFTHGEKDTAIAIAKSWHTRDWQPFLYSKTYKGEFKVWYDWRTVKLPKKKAA